MIEDVLFVTNYHTRNLFYEETVRRLYQNGFKNWYVQNTSTKVKYQGLQDQGVVVSDASHQNIFTGLQIIWNKFKDRPPKQKIIIHLDDDTFICKPDLLEQYVRYFLSSKFKFAGTFRSALYNKLYKFNKLIVPFQSTALHSCNWRPDTITQPYCSGCLALFDRDTFLQYEIPNWAHSQLKMQEDNLKRGAFYADHLWDITFWTSEWVHIGNVSLFWYLFDGTINYDYGNNHFIRLASHPEHQFKIGYLMAQEAYFGNLDLKYFLGDYFKNTGSTKDACVKVWNDNIQRILPLKEYSL